MLKVWIRKGGDDVDQRVYTFNLSFCLQ